MQNLVRVGIADPAQNPGIGQRALQRVILARQRVLERVDIDVVELEAAPIVAGERRVSAL